MQEAVFYHALNVSGNPGYGTLRKQYARRGSWEKCWLRSGAGNIDPEREWAALSAQGIGLVLAGDPEYPSLLLETPDPPFGIYFKGALGAAVGDPSVALVGTRRASATGRDLAKDFGSVLARARCTIVSGLAFGIDAAGHAGALEGKGRTVAVLANGLDSVHPSSNQLLADHIIEGGGVLLSEYPPGSPPLAYRFLERNRIVSGLSRAVLAIEVPERSGVLATARFALEQNRDLFIVPGPVGHPNYKGSHRLIRAGATLVSDPQELLEDLGFQPAAKLTAAFAETPEEENVSAVMRAAGRPLAIDEIIEAATLTSSKTNQALTTLVLKGAVREEGGRYALR